jgi:hypothetical protein
MDIRPRGWSSGGWGPPRRSMERRTILSSSRAIAASDRCAIPGLRLAQRSTSRPCSSTSSSVRTPRHQPETAQRSRRCSSSLIFGASTKASVRPPAPLPRRTGAGGGTRGPQELSRLRPRGARAGASCPLPRRPREPRDPSRAVLGAQRCDPPTPFLRSFVRTDAQARVPVHGGGFSFLGCNLATGRPFLGVALRLPRLGRAPGGVPGGVLRNAKVRPDVQPLRVQRPGRPFLVPGSTLSPHQAPRRMLAKVGAAAGQAAPGRRHGPEEGAPFAPAVCSLPRRNGTVPFRAGTAPASPRP